MTYELKLMASLSETNKMLAKEKDLKSRLTLMSLKSMIIQELNKLRKKEVI